MRMGGGLVERCVAQKTRHEQQIPKSSELAEVFWGQVRKGLGTTRFDQKEWSVPKVVRA